MKKYDIPEELCELMKDSMAAEDARDSAVKGYFKHQLRNAVTLGRMARDKKDEFWEGVRSLYPELSDKSLTFEPGNKIVFIKED